MMVHAEHKDTADYTHWHKILCDGGSRTAYYIYLAASY